MKDEKRHRRSVFFHPSSFIPHPFLKVIAWMTPYNTNLPPDLRHMKEEIEGYARGYGLDFFETIFEVIDADDLNEVAAYGGFPTRYPHWSFGMSYEELRKGYDYGLSKIYEMVINNNPCYAYLMRCESCDGSEVGDGTCVWTLPSARDAGRDARRYQGDYGSVRR